MQDASLNAYNSVFNQLFKSKQQFYALALAFEKSMLFGFHDFAMNESHERWEYSEMIRRHVAENNRKIIIADLPAPVQDFSDMAPGDVLKKGLEHDNAILNSLNTAIIAAEPGEIVYMTKIRDIMQGQINEVAGYLAKMGFKGSSIYKIDELLFGIFGKENNGY